MCCMWKTMDMCRTEPSAWQGWSKVKAWSYVWRNIHWCFPGLHDGKDKPLCRRFSSKMCSCPGYWCLMRVTWHQQVPGPLLLQGSFSQWSLGHAGTTEFCAAAQPPPAGRGIMGIGSTPGKGLAQGCSWRGRAELCARKKFMSFGHNSSSPSKLRLSKIWRKRKPQNFYQDDKHMQSQKKVFLFVKEEAAEGVFWHVGIWFQPGLTQLCSTNPIVGRWFL